MSVEIVESTRKSRSKKPAPTVQRFTLFGPPLLLEGEDADAYQALQARIHAAVQPRDIIEEIFVNDVIALQWEILRWRGLKRSLVSACGLEALENFVRHELDDNPYKDAPLSVATVLGDSLGTNDEAAREAKSLVRGYKRKKKRDVERLNKLLQANDRSIESFMDNALAQKIDDIERIDRLTTNAETRRNACLREITSYRATFGEALRRSVKEVEDAEFEDVTLSPKNGEGQRDQSKEDQCESR